MQVTVPVEMMQSIKTVAHQHTVSFVDMVHHLVSVGFEDFDERTFEEASVELLSMLQTEVDNWPTSHTEEIVVELDRRLDARLRSTAKQFNKPSPQFIVMCMAHGLVLESQTKSGVLKTG